MHISNVVPYTQPSLSIGSVGRAVRPRAELRQRACARADADGHRRQVRRLDARALDRRAQPGHQRGGDAGAAEHAGRDGARRRVGADGLLLLVEDVAAQEAGDHVQVPGAHQGELGQLCVIRTLH